MMLSEKYKNYFQKQKKAQLRSVFKMIKDWSRAKFPLSHLCWMQHIHVGGEQVDLKIKDRRTTGGYFLGFFQKSYYLLWLRDGKSADGWLKEVIYVEGQGLVLIVATCSFSAHSYSLSSNKETSTVLSFKSRIH